MRMVWNSVTRDHYKLTVLFWDKGNEINLSSEETENEIIYLLIYKGAISLYFSAL